MTTKDKIREWISDNLRYMLLIGAILLIVAAVLLIVHLVSPKNDGKSSGGTVTSSSTGNNVPDKKTQVKADSKADSEDSTGISSDVSDSANASSADASSTDTASAPDAEAEPTSEPEAADDTYRPERAKPFPKRVVIFSPHPDDDVISMGGTLRRLVQQGHEVHVAYETSGNIAVGDEEVVRFMHFINGFNQLFDDNSNETIKNKYAEIKKFLAAKKEGDMDTRDILTIKGLIRRGEARTACTFNQVPLSRCHFLDLPFYETGKIEKNPISEADVEIVLKLLREVKPHQIFVAGDLADPHGTHRVCTDAVLAAIDIEKEAGAEWLKDCRTWMYRGAWAEWEIENIEMAVPFSPEELRAKRNSILKHQSQMESAPFLGNDERLFWQRSEDRNRGTAALYDQLGLACYEAMEAFVEYVPL